MSPEAIARTSIVRAHDQVVAADRAAQLLARIKIETRWLLASTPARTFEIDDSHYAEDRAEAVATWSRARRRRIALNDARAFYSIAADQASLLAHLIEIRRQRNARPQQ
jgi:hypothetical protein